MADDTDFMGGDNSKWYNTTTWDTYDTRPDDEMIGNGPDLMGDQQYVPKYQYGQTNDVMQSYTDRFFNTTGRPKAGAFVNSVANQYNLTPKQINDTYRGYLGSQGLTSNDENWWGDQSTLAHYGQALGSAGYANDWQTQYNQGQDQSETTNLNASQGAMQGQGQNHSDWDWFPGVLAILSADAAGGAFGAAGGAELGWGAAGGDPTGLSAGYAADIGLSPTMYPEAVNSMSGDPTGLGPGEFLDGNINNASNYGMDRVPQNTLEQQGSLTEGVSPNSVNMTEAAYPQQTPPKSGLESLFSKGKEIMKSPQYQLAKTGIDLFSQFGDRKASRAGLDRFNELADRGQWANQAGQNLYTNPNAFFNSPMFRQAQAGFMDTYRRQQAQRGRRADTAGLALAMQKFGADQFNNYSNGLSRYNQQPNTNGLQQLYAGAGRSESNILNTLANKDLWDALGRLYE